MLYTKFDTSLCPIVIAGDEAGIQHIHLCETEGSKRSFDMPDEWHETVDVFNQAKTQLLEYLAGDREQFDLLLNPQGTPFQKRVWDQLLNIPYGEACSYLDIATGIGNQKACRAVGAANGKNPIPLVIPCHRVVGSNGKLTGYAFGLGIKQALLDIESKGQITGSLWEN